MVTRANKSFVRKENENSQQLNTNSSLQLTMVLHHEGWKVHEQQDYEVQAH